MWVVRKLLNKQWYIGYFIEGRATDVYRPNEYTHIFYDEGAAVTVCDMLNAQDENLKATL